MHVGGGQYEGRDTTRQTIPQTVARAVATIITGALRPIERTALASRPPRDPGAYDRFLRATYELAQRPPRAVRRAIDQYESAVRLDPGFTPALARVAVGYGLFLDWGWEYPGLSPEAVLSRGFDAADRALQQDSASADAWMARGFLLSFRNPRTFAGVREALLRALALDPRNAEAHHQYGMALLWLGRDSAAADMYRRALQLEPERPITMFNLGRVAARGARYAEARRWAGRALSLDPRADHPPAARGSGTTYGRRSSTPSDPIRGSPNSSRSRRRNEAGERSDGLAIRGPARVRVTVRRSGRPPDRPAAPLRLSARGRPLAAPRPRAVGPRSVERHRPALARPGLHGRVPPLLSPPRPRGSRALQGAAVQPWPGALSA